ncbi:MAG: DUF116 domain-containing protein [Candidatus Micrarchaeia archaeon]
MVTELKEDGIKMKIKDFAARALAVGLHASVSDIANKIAHDIGVLDDKWVKYTIIELHNGLNKDFYKTVPKKDRVVFIPHCLRNIKECKMPIDEDGYHCLKCGKCVINEIVKECEKNGMKYFIVGGGSQVINIVEKHKPKAVLGIACFNELQLAVEKLGGGKKFPGQGVMLRRDGCVNTLVDMEEVKEKMNL